MNMDIILGEVETEAFRSAVERIVEYAMQNGLSEDEARVMVVTKCDELISDYHFMNMCPLAATAFRDNHPGNVQINHK